MVHLRVMYSYRCNMTDVYVTLDWVLWMWGGDLPDRWVSGDQFAISAHIRADRSECFSATAPRWDTLDPFIPASIVSHNEVLLFSASVEIEKHQRYRPRSTSDEFIHPQSPPLFNLPLFCLHFRFCILGPKIPFPVPLCLTFWFPWTNASLSSKSFFSPFFPQPSQELIDTWTQQAARNHLPAATDKTACAS